MVQILKSTSRTFIYFLCVSKTITITWSKLVEEASNVVLKVDFPNPQLLCHLCQIHGLGALSQRIFIFQYSSFKTLTWIRRYSSTPIPDLIVNILCGWDVEMVISDHDNSIGQYGKMTNMHNMATFQDGDARSLTGEVKDVLMK